jgi:uncharacterized sulfatase
MLRQNVGHASLRRIVSARCIASVEGWIRSFRIVAASVTLALWLVGSTAPASAQERAVSAPPNVVMILSDDQAWTDYGFMGHPIIRTPRLDRLASESLVYTRGYVPSSLCSPSLASIITGLYPHQHGITGNDPRPPADYSGGWALSPERTRAYAEYIERMRQLPTLPRWLGDRGYRSLQTGKWWLGDFSQGGFTEGMTHGDPARGGRHGDAGLAIGRQGMEPIERFVKQAAADQAPFLLWYAPFLPHTPHNPPEQLLQHYQQLDLPIQVARYYAMVEWFDQTCGQLLDLLDQTGVADNTLVVYVCDNGWIQSHPGMDLPDGWSREGYAPGSKRSPNEGGIRTPIMLRWPARIQPRLERQQLASSIDLAPTILSAVGVEPAEPLPGIDLLDPDQVAGRERIFGDIYDHDMPGGVDDPLAGLQYRWVIDGEWKLIVPRGISPQSPVIIPPAGEETVMLYQLDRDPHEQVSVADRYPDQVRRLWSELDAWLVDPSAP